MSFQINEMISEKDVKSRIQELADQISLDYRDKELKLICVLKGGVYFLCELSQRITVPVSIDFMSVSSYGAGTESSGIVKIIKDLDESITDENVLVVEDIIDSGRTLAHLMELLKSRQPASLKLCTLLDKPDRRVTEVNIDYCGFTVPDEYIIGYGMDLDQKYRNLPYIGSIQFGEEE